MQLDASELPGRIEGRDRGCLGLLDDERTSSLLRPSYDNGPLGGVTVENKGLDPVENPGPTLPSGPGGDGVQWISVTGFVQRHRSPGPAGSQGAQQVLGSKGPGGDGRQNRRREERAGERDATHLGENDAHLGKTGPGASQCLGHEQSGPAQLDEGAPESIVDTVDVIGQPADEVPVGRALHRLARHVAKRLLLWAEGEVHATVPSVVTLMSRLATVDVGVGRRRPDQIQSRSTGKTARRRTPRTAQQVAHHGPSELPRKLRGI